MPHFLLLFWKDHPAELQIQGAKAALHLLREAMDFFPRGKPKTGRRKASGPAAHLKIAQEGFNNRICWLIRQAYGFRDKEYFKLKIYQLPEINTEKTI